MVLSTKRNGRGGEERKEEEQKSDQVRSGQVRSRSALLCPTSTPPCLFRFFPVTSHGHFIIIIIIINTVTNNNNNNNTNNNANSKTITITITALLLKYSHSYSGWLVITELTSFGIGFDPSNPRTMNRNGSMRGWAGNGYLHHDLQLTHVGMVLETDFS